jgi:hypothetical protein
MIVYRVSINNGINVKVIYNFIVPVEVEEIVLDMLVLQIHRDQRHLPLLHTLLMDHHLQ